MIENLKNTNKNDKNGSNAENNYWWSQGLILFARFSSWIIAPVLLGVFLGRWLENKFGGGQFIFLATVGVSFLISMAGLVLETTKEYRRIEEESKKNKDKK